MTPTDPTALAMRVQAAFAKFAADEIVGCTIGVGQFAEGFVDVHDPDDPLAYIRVSEILALATALADAQAEVAALRQENADVWTELNLCRQMCRDAQPARLGGDAWGGK